jgi:hypothetical protein
MKEDPENLDWEKTELNAYLDIARINDSIDNRNYQLKSMSDLGMDIPLLFKKVNY